jgi:hypothetical protein
MWGYAFLGISTMFTAGYYKERNKEVKLLLICNGIISIGSAVWSVIEVEWVMTTVGLICYFGWNSLMITLMTMVYRAHRTHRSSEQREP